MFNPASAMAAAVGLDAASSLVGQRYALERQHQAQDFSAQQFSTRYQTMVKDLKAAGLNPMLAYGSGAGSSPSGSASSATGPNAGGTYLNARVANAQVANTEEDTKNKSALNEQITQQTEVYKTTAEQNKKLIEKISADIEVARQNLHNLQAQWLRDTSDAKLKDALTASEGFYQRLVEQQERLIKNQILITNPQAEAAATTGAFAAHGKNISEGISPLTDVLQFKNTRVFDPMLYKRNPQKKYPKKVSEE